MSLSSPHDSRKYPSATFAGRSQKIQNPYRNATIRVMGSWGQGAACQGVQSVEPGYTDRRVTVRQRAWADRLLKLQGVRDAAAIHCLRYRLGMRHFLQTELATG